MSEKPISPLRRRMTEDMTVRNFVEKTRNDYIRHVRAFTAFLGRAPDTATPEDLRLFERDQIVTFGGLAFSLRGGRGGGGIVGADQGDSYGLHRAAALAVINRHAIYLRQRLPRLQILSIRTACRTRA